MTNRSIVMRTRFLKGHMVLILETNDNGTSTASSQQIADRNAMERQKEKEHRPVKPSSNSATSVSDGAEYIRVRVELSFVQKIRCMSISKQNVHGNIFMHLSPPSH